MKKLTSILTGIIFLTTIFTTYAKDCGAGCQSNYQTSYDSAVQTARDASWDVLYENMSLISAMWVSAETSVVQGPSSGEGIGASLWGIFDIMKDALPGVWEDCAAIDAQFDSEINNAADSFFDCMSAC